MADNSNVGRTVGIVIGVTAVVGLGLYFILKPKAAVASSNTNIPAPSSASASQIAELQAQLAKMQADAVANQNKWTQSQKDANKEQLNSILLTLGGKLAGSALDKWTSSWGTDKNTYLDTSLADTAPSYVTDSIWVDTKYGYLSPWG